MSKKTYSPPRLEAFNPQAYNRPAAPMACARDFRTIAGRDVIELMERWGSPLVVIDETALRDTYRRLHRAFSSQYENFLVGWSYKTCYLSAVCCIFREEGAWAEVVSGFEYDIARDLGVPGNEIIFNGPVKTDGELTTAFNEGAVVNLDSFDELARVIAHAEERDETLEVGIRVNMNLNYPPWSKFGFNYENGQAFEAVRRAHASGRLKVTGLHIHTGTFVLEPLLYKRATENLIALANKIERTFGWVITSFDLGGGYATGNTLLSQVFQGTMTSPTIEQYADAICPTLANYARERSITPRLVVEPGRYLVDECITTLTTVVSSKTFSNGQHGVIVDSGVNILPTAYWYKHDTEAITKDEFVPLEKQNVLGGLCMNIDVLRTETPLPPLSAGDVLRIKNTGAYNLTQSMQFIYRRPNYILLDTAGQDHLVRRAEDNSYIRAREELPGHLQSEESGASELVRKHAKKVSA